MPERIRHALGLGVVAVMLLACVAALALG